MSCRSIRNIFWSLPISLPTIQQRLTKDSSQRRVGWFPVFFLHFCLWLHLWESDPSGYSTCECLDAWLQVCLFHICNIAIWYCGICIEPFRMTILEALPIQAKEESLEQCIVRARQVPPKEVALQLYIWVDCKRCNTFIPDAHWDNFLWVTRHRELQCFDDLIIIIVIIIQSRSLNLNGMRELGYIIRQIINVVHIFLFRMLERLVAEPTEHLRRLTKGSVWLNYSFSLIVNIFSIVGHTGRLIRAQSLSTVLLILIISDLLAIIGIFILCRKRFVWDLAHSL